MTDSLAAFDIFKAGPNTKRDKTLTLGGFLGDGKKISNDEEKHKYAVHIKGRQQSKRKEKKNRVSVLHYYYLSFSVIHYVFKNTQIRRNQKIFI